MSEPSLGKKRSWIRRDRENDSYCRACKTWKPKTEFDSRDVERGLIHFECRECRLRMRSWVRRDREDESYCRTCKTWKPKNEFYYRNAELRLLEYDCMECLKAHRRKSYANHRTTTRASNDEWTRRTVEIGKEYVYNYLLAHPCADCGNNNILTLTFDHVQGEKYFNVSEMVSRGRSLETIKAEIEKCEVVCFNCHMRRERRKRSN